jgi:AraC-like DNA-binding protein
MVKNGQTGSTELRPASVEIERRGYRPPASYKLDLEIVRMADLRARVKGSHLRSVHRIEFHMLICVTEGECEHFIDFEPILAKQGSLLLLQPSQAEQFDLSSDWDGWLVLFRPEFLFAHSQNEHTGNVDIIAVLESLPEHSILHEPEYRIAVSIISQMAEDSKQQTLPSELNALIRYQLSALILRLGMAQRHRFRQDNVSSKDICRFIKFKQLVEQKFMTWHKVKDYAAAIGCSEKSVTRATCEVTGITAKIFIANRINLEAKRLLTHTVSRITNISDQLGFDEPTNFVKFFKRESGCTPAEFRIKQCNKN